MKRARWWSPSPSVSSIMVRRLKSARPAASFGHAHAAMQLDRLLADEARCLADAVLGGGDGAAALVRVCRCCSATAASRPSSGPAPGG